MSPRSNTTQKHPRLSVIHTFHNPPNPRPERPSSKFSLDLPHLNHLGRANWKVRVVLATAKWTSLGQSQQNVVFFVPFVLGFLVSFWCVMCLSNFAGVLPRKIQHHSSGARIPHWNCTHDKLQSQKLYSKILSSFGRFQVKHRFDELFELTNCWRFHFAKQRYSMMRARLRCAFGLRMSHLSASRIAKEINQENSWEWQVTPGPRKKIVMIVILHRSSEVRCN